MQDLSASGWLDFLLELAERADAIALDWFRRQDLDVSAKSDRTPVTAADLQIEREVRTLAQARFPRLGLIGEEYGASASADVNLIVDPIKTLDASLSYKITENLTATLDGSNLLDQAYHDYHGTPLLPRDVRRYDRVVGFALRWKH